MMKLPVLQRWGARRSVGAPSALLVIALLGSCQTTGSGVIAERTPAERIAIGVALEEKLLRVRPQQPIFATRRRLAPAEQSALADFVGTLPSGRLIEGGNPIYWIEIGSKLDVYFKYQKLLTYEAIIRRADSGAVIAKNSHSSNCMDSEALYTSPIRCSLLGPMLLRRSLEGL